MRELKFRVWDKGYKVFLPSDIYHIHNRTSFGSFGIMRTNWKDYKEGEYFYDNGQILEEFTGLIDRNKKEVFEGDIVSLDNLSTHRWVIEYKGCSFVAEPLKNNAFLEMRTLRNNNYLQFEVIGNIHENSELIN